MRAAPPKAPLVAQILWRPDFGRVMRKSFELEVPEWDEKILTAKVVSDAKRSMTFLHDLRRRYMGGGRPEGTKKGRRLTRLQFLEWYREASQGFANDGDRVTLSDLKAVLGVRSDTTAKNRLNEVGLPWPPESFPDVWEEGW